MLRASNLLSQTINKSTVLSLPLDISQNLVSTLTDTVTETNDLSSQGSLNHPAIYINSNYSKASRYFMVLETLVLTLPLVSIVTRVTNV